MLLTVRAGLYLYHSDVSYIMMPNSQTRNLAVRPGEEEKRAHIRDVIGGGVLHGKAVSKLPPLLAKQVRSQWHTSVL